jgi:hypothetical protein
VPVGVGRQHRLDAQDPSPQLAVADRLSGSHRRSTVGLGRIMVAWGKRELREDAGQVAELDIEAVVAGWCAAVGQQPAHPRHVQPDLLGQLGWLGRGIGAATRSIA